MLTTLLDQLQALQGMQQVTKVLQALLGMQERRKKCLLQALPGMQQAITLAVTNLLQAPRSKQEKNPSPAVKIPWI